MSLDHIVQFACAEGEIRHLRLILGIARVEELDFDDPCGIAAAHGNITVLAILREHGIPWGTAFSKAIDRNQFHVLQWMLKNTGARAPTSSQSTSLPPSLVYRRAALRSV